MNSPRSHQLPATRPMSLSWRKSSYSNGAEQCVEVADLPGGLAVRDSKDTAIPGLRAGAGAWNAFVRAVGTDRLCAAPVPSPRPEPGRRHAALWRAIGR